MISKRRHAQISGIATVSIALLIGISGPLRAQERPQNPPAVTAPSSPSKGSASNISSTAGSGFRETPPSPAPVADTASASSAVTTNDSASSHELSPWSMFLSADIIVKLVMIGLAFASLVTWTICIAKMVELSLARRNLGTALREISESRSLAEVSVVRTFGADGCLI